MFSALFYVYSILLCTVFLLVSGVAWVVTVPFDKGRRVVHELSRALTMLFFATPPRWRATVKGLEHVDRNKAYVIVMNHRAMLDIGALYYVPLNFRWVSKREIYKMPFFGQFLWLHGDICIDRNKPREAAEQLLTDGQKWLGRGVSVAIFPEGTRSKTDKLGRFKRGAFDLAEMAGVEVLPVVVRGSDRILKPGGGVNWRSRVRVEVLKPRRNPDMEQLREAMQEVYDKL